MRNIITILLLLPFISQAQFTDKYVAEKRNYKDNSGTYIVQYDYNILGGFSIPATSPPGAPHYDAYITVYEIKGEDTLIVGDPFNGTYVPGGCFEDMPAYMVNVAKRLEEIKRKKYLEIKKKNT